MRSQLLWNVLAGAYARLGFDAIADEAFSALVLTRIIEPTSKADSLRVLEEIGVTAPALRTVFRALGRCARPPTTLAEHFEPHGDYFTDGRILESSRVMGTGRHARTRRIVYQYSFKRRKRDDRAINAMIERAERIATGKAPMSKARFLKVTAANKEIESR
jgi:hypothetical protein